MREYDTLPARSRAFTFPQAIGVSGGPLPSSWAPTLLVRQRRSSSWRGDEDDDAESGGEQGALLEASDRPGGGERENDGECVGETGGDGGGIPGQEVGAVTITPLVFF